MSPRTYTDYSTFNWLDEWFVEDQDARIQLDGVSLSGALRGDGITLDGIGGQSGTRPGAGRPPTGPPLVPPRNPHVFLPPR